MKSAKFFIVSIFIFALTLQISARKIEFSNELKGFEFYKRGKLKDIELLSSTREQIQEILGVDCFFGGCSYDEDWDLGFVYYWTEFQRLKHENGVEKTYIVSPQYVDRLYAIILTPKKSLIFDRKWFSENFKEYDTVGEHSVELKGFADSNGLGYTLYFGDSQKKGILTKIHYTVPENLREVRIYINRHRRKTVY